MIYLQYFKISQDIWIRLTRTIIVLSWQDKTARISEIETDMLSTQQQQDPSAERSKK